MDGYDATKTKVLIGSEMWGDVARRGRVGQGFDTPRTIESYSCPTTERLVHTYGGRQSQRCVARHANRGTDGEMLRLEEVK